MDFLSRSMEPLKVGDLAQTMVNGVWQVVKVEEVESPERYKVSIVRPIDFDDLAEGQSPFRTLK